MSSATPRFEVTGEDGTSVVVRKTRTRNGMKLSVESDTETIRIDALALESLSWQRSEDLVALPEFEQRFVGDTADGDDRTIEETIEISNEFAQVLVHRISANLTDWIEIVSPKRDYNLRISPAGLECLTEIDPDLFSTFLEQPYGPIHSED